MAPGLVGGAKKKGQAGAPQSRAALAGPPSNPAVLGPLAADCANAALKEELKKLYAAIFRRSGSKEGAWPVNVQVIVSRGDDVTPILRGGAAPRELGGFIRPWNWGAMNWGGTASFGGHFKDRAYRPAPRLVTKIRGRGKAAPSGPSVGDFSRSLFSPSSPPVLLFYPPLSRQARREASGWHERGTPARPAGTFARRCVPRRAGCRPDPERGVQPGVPGSSHGGVHPRLRCRQRGPGIPAARPPRRPCLLRRHPERVEAV